MKVKLRLWGVFQDIVGERELSLELPEGARIRDLLEGLVKRHGKRFGDELFEPGGEEIRPFVKILLNGHGTTPSARLHDGDTIAIFPPVGGGSPEEKVIHDPVHGSMRLGGLVLDLLNTPEVQRLRGIRQLGLANLVFPGANHTRFEHVLGVANLVSRLGSELELPKHEQDLLLSAAMLHDVGHPAYSHTLEYLMKEYLGKAHMRLTGDILRGKADIVEEKELERLRGLKIPTAVQALAKHDISTEELASLLLGKHRRSYLGQLIHSEVDVDQMDYLLRDAHFTGVALGMVDIERLMRTLVIHGGCLAIARKGVEAVEGLLTARALMYSSVYFHHTVRIAEMMLANAVEFAISAGGPITSDNFYRLTDSGLMEGLSATPGYPSEIVTRLRYRQLFKSAYVEERRELKAPERRKLLKLYGSWRRVREVQDAIAGEAGAPGGYVVLDVPIVDILVSEPRLVKVEVPVLEDGKLTKLSRVSPLAIALKRRQAPRYLLRVVTAEKYLGRVKRAAEKILP